ncbi:MAG: wax ester/triacylglycerol synthase family O-acyltransferase [Gammaproteobacteria bacterium]|nr:wax ester/triacylglycerol synthase family O-acyltransferase [Gammaproteobacteria bacterium]MBK7727494.1 wax ester/triacylglycerol synthase family O-acyltransferase [Gammaproteobacteria bacterium]
MRQLGIIDAAFINLENPTVPQQIGSLGIYDPSTAPGGFVRFKNVLANFEQRLSRLPIFRTRLVEVPLGLDRPYWVLDPHFDVEFHIRHIALPKPGDWRQLCIQVARLHSRPLDMSRPLWEAYIIEGLDNIPGLPEGSFAIYTKMHHSLVDGAGGQDFMAAIHDLEPVPHNDGSVAEEPRARLFELQASDISLLGRTLLRLPTRIWGNAKGGAELVGSMYSTLRRIMRDELPATQLSGPKTRFDEPVGHNRVFDARLFSLDDIKAMKNAGNVTINDIAVAIVAGALRRYLQAHDELPQESLLASMPVNMRARVGETGDNNQVGAMSGSLHTNIADPLERLQAIKKSLDDAKAYIDTPLVSIMKLPGALPPLIAKPLTRAYVRNKLTRQLPMGQATVITNVPGPPFPLYCAGARMTRFYPLGLINPGLGLFHAVFSCSGQISISVLADRDQMPDPEFYTQCLDASYDELHKALLGSAGAKAIPARAGAAKSAAPRKAKSPSAARAAAKKPPARRARVKKAAAVPLKAAAGTRRGRPKKAASTAKKSVARRTRPATASAAAAAPKRVSRKAE